MADYWQYFDELTRALFDAPVSTVIIMVSLGFLPFIMVIGLRVIFWLWRQSTSKVSKAELPPPSAAISTPSVEEAMTIRSTTSATKIISQEGRTVALDYGTSNTLTVEDITIEGIASDAVLLPPDTQGLFRVDYTNQDEEFSRKTVFFGTDRELVSEENADFGWMRGHQLRFGFCEVTIPNTERFGKILRPKRKLAGFLRREAEDPRKHFTFSERHLLKEEKFCRLVEEVVSAGSQDKGTALVFLHGFNVTFDTAIFRAAQIAADARFEGPVFAYSWPAVGGGLRGIWNYPTDLESADEASPHFDKFISTILRIQGIERVQLIAHSMGNKLLAKWVETVGLDLQRRGGRTLDQLLLAAPDIDRRKFEDISDKFLKHANGVTLYACSTDIALRVSKTLRRNYVRAGDVPSDGKPIVVEGVDTIDISALGIHWTEARKYTAARPFLDHSMFADDLYAMTDIAALIKTGIRPPNLRTGTLKTGFVDSRPYWIVPK